MDNLGKRFFIYLYLNVYRISFGLLKDKKFRVNILFSLIRFGLIEKEDILNIILNTNNIGIYFRVKYWFCIYNYLEIILTIFGHTHIHRSCLTLFQKILLKSIFHTFDQSTLNIALEISQLIIRRRGMERKLARFSRGLVLI